MKSDSNTVLTHQAQLANLQLAHAIFSCSARFSPLLRHSAVVRKQSPACNLNTNQPEYEINLASYLQVLFLKYHGTALGIPLHHCTFRGGQWSRRISCNNNMRSSVNTTCMFQTRTRIPTQYPKSNLAPKKKIDPAFCVCMLSFVHLTAVPASCSSDAGAPRVCALLQGT